MKKKIGIIMGFLFFASLGLLMVISAEEKAIIKGDLPVDSSMANTAQTANRDIMKEAGSAWDKAEMKKLHVQAIQKINYFVDKGDSANLKLIIDYAESLKPVTPVGQPKVNETG